MLMETLSTEQRQAYDAIIRGDSIFLTGPGGTGKSHLIGLLADRLPALGRTLAITALTGCAAVILGHGAKTFHSWAGIGLGKDSAEMCAKNIKSPAKRRWKNTDVLIIDEISMLTPDLLEMIEKLARILRESSRPMGGLQVLFVGDFLQLPPVSRSGTLKFAFESPVWAQCVKATIQLKRIFRQNDPVFQSILDEARIGELSDASLTTLKTRCNLSWDDAVIKPTMLFSRNTDVDSINNSHLENIEESSYVYTATLASGLPIPKSMTRTNDASYVPELNLKVGAQVMLLINLKQEYGLVNGSRGVVIGFKEAGSFPIVKFMNGRCETIKYHVWQDTYVEQIPLRLAYALTIHKAQGATLDCAVIDVGSNIFEYGQAYTALSRLKSLEGLYIHQISKAAFRAHPLVKSFYAGTYESPPPPPPEPVRSVLVIPAPHRIAPIKGSKASYGFDDDGIVPQQSSLKDYFGVPAKPVEPELPTIKRGMYGVDASKYPARMGKQWDDEEIIKMLMAIQKKKPTKEIAEVHERTVGGVTSKLRGLAVDYYNNDKKPIEEIQKITGLSATIIQEAITKKNNGAAQI